METKRDKAVFQRVANVLQVATQLAERVNTLEQSLTNGLRVANPATKEQKPQTDAVCEYDTMLREILTTLERVDEQAADILERLEV